MDVSDTSLRWLTVLVGVALAIVIGLGSAVGSSAVADDLRPDVELVLADGGLDGVQVELIGREVTLSEGSHADLAEAEQLVADVAGVRSVRVEESADAAPTPAPAPTSGSTAESRASLELRTDAQRIVISGRVPDADSAASIKSGAALTFGRMVSGDLEVDGSAGAADWATALPDLFGDLVGVKALRLSIGAAGTVRIAGTIESSAGRDKISRYVSEALPDLALTNELTIDRGRLSKADATALNEATVIFDPASAVVTFTAAQPLDAVADVLRRNPRLTIVAGAQVGGSDGERRLTRQRLSAVKGYLVAFGIDADRVVTRSHTAGAPAATSASAERHRRVDFIVKES